MTSRRAQSPASPKQQQQRSHLILLPPEIRQNIFAHIFTPTLHLHGEIPERHPILPQELHRLRLRLSPCLNPSRSHKFRRREACVKQGCSHPDPEIWPVQDHRTCLDSDVGVAWMRCCKLVYSEATTVLFERTTLQIPSPEVLQRLALGSLDSSFQPFWVKGPFTPSRPRCPVSTTSISRIRHLIITANIANGLFFVGEPSSCWPLLPDLRSLVLEADVAGYPKWGFHEEMGRFFWVSKVEPLRYFGARRNEVRVLGGVLRELPACGSHGADVKEGPVVEQTLQQDDGHSRWSQQDREILSARLRSAFEGTSKPMDDEEMLDRMDKAVDKSLCIVSLMLDQ